MKKPPKPLTREKSHIDIARAAIAAAKAGGGA
jgi:hypothetical protein